MATIQKKSFWQQYGSLILILGGIIIGALIGAFPPRRGHHHQAGGRHLP